MTHTDEVTLSFNSDFIGRLTSPSGSILLGDQPGGMEPYHLLYGALASCFYATFLGIAIKKRLTFERVEIKVSGEKRETIPTTLAHVKIELDIYQASNEVPFRKAAELGAKYCSIHETIAQVAQIELVVTFCS